MVKCKATISAKHVENFRLSVNPINLNEFLKSQANKIIIMKKIITTVFVSVFLISVSCSAQKMKNGNMQQMLKDSLHLTSVQIDSVTSIREQFMGKIKEVNSNSSLSADQKKEQIKPLRMQMKERMKTILTADQMTKMEAMQKEMHKGKMQEENQ